MISHGTGGSHLVYRETAAFLARNGFVVAQPEHPFNNRNDNTWENRCENLIERPKTIRKTINVLAEDPRLSVDPNRCCVIGHSMGGYTALAVIGGKPVAFSRETEDHKEHPVPVKSDERVKAAVLLAPATPWYRDPKSLQEVRVPILMLTGEKDDITGCWHADNVRNGLSDKTLLDHRVVPNAGHFSFEAPFQDSMKRPGFAPATDPAGFDRAAYQKQMNNEILELLRKQMPE